MTTTTTTTATAPKAYVTRYDRRVRLVADALTQNSQLTDEDAVALAKHVLNALDHIPETIR